MQWIEDQKDQGMDKKIMMKSIDKDIHELIAGECYKTIISD